MEYYYSGTESFWCGNWNHLVCRRWRCEVDHPSQSTVVNLGKKQKLCSLWCLLSQVQQDTSGPDNFRILGFLWTIHQPYTYKLDWTEMLNVSFPLRAKTRTNKIQKSLILFFITHYIYVIMYLKIGFVNIHQSSTNKLWPQIWNKCPEDHYVGPVQIVLGFEVDHIFHTVFA